MKIVTSTCVFPHDTDIFENTIRLARLGFDTLDLAFDYCAMNKNCDFMGSNYKDWAKKLREATNSIGVTFTHSHAPFDAACQSDIVKNTMECAEILGIKYIVVHPIWRKPDGSYYDDFNEFIELNARAIKPILETAKEHGIIVLSENLLWGASIHAEALSNLVDAVNSPYFGWCYDTGHANAHDLKSTALIGLKHAPLSLHIQDNNGNYRDEHLIPGDGSIDWKEFLDVLKTIGYKGDFVLEAHHQSLESPDEKRDEILTELLNRSRKMVKYFGDSSKISSLDYY